MLGYPNVVEANRNLMKKINWIAFFCIAFAAGFLNACNDGTSVDELVEVEVSSSSEKSSSSVKCGSSKGLYPDSFKPCDDQYPYVGIPRIVIETENRQKIKDRETEIPAKLQIWGEKEAESEIMNLTIRGRGNTSWSFPKKPYLIKLDKKQSLLGLPKSKKWVLLANYRDRTLVRNAVSFKIASCTQQDWVPQGSFVDVFLNGKPIGNYYLTEKISNDKLNDSLNENAFVLELDTYYNEIYKFKTEYKKLPVNVKFPNEPTLEQLAYIKDYMDSVETLLYNETSLDYKDYIDVSSVVDYWIIYELTQNNEPTNPKSVYMHKRNGGLLKMGPVWDFDWITFTNKKKGLLNKNAVWNDALMEKKEFRNLVKKKWKNYKYSFEKVVETIDSLNSYLEKTNKLNLEMWPIQIEDHEAIGDENLPLEKAFGLFKRVYVERINELDSLFNAL